jgi:hypothetical protein
MIVSSGLASNGICGLPREPRIYVELPGRFDQMAQHYTCINSPAWETGQSNLTHLAMIWMAIGESSSALSHYFLRNTRPVKFASLWNPVLSVLAAKLHHITCLSASIVPSE